METRSTVCDDDDGDDKHCVSNSFRNCSNVCPADCLCSGFSVNCSNLNIPVYSTSVTLIGFSQMEATVTFNESYSNLRHLRIINCQINSLEISSSLNIEILEINQSSIVRVKIIGADQNLRLVSFTKTMIEEFLLSSSQAFDFYVEDSSIFKYQTRNVKYLTSVNVKMFNTQTFPYIIYNIYSVVLNLSFCNMEFQPESYYKVKIVDLRHNRLTSWHFLSFTQVLYLQSNQIRAINFSLDKSSSDSLLQYLDLSDNSICCIGQDDFTDLYNLLHLKLRNNGLNYIHQEAFSVLLKLVHLDLSSNNLSDLERSHFLHLRNLQYLYLQNNQLKVVEGLFDGLFNILYLEVDSYTLCCAQPRAVGQMQCSAPVNEISSCHNLIDTPLLSVIIWYIAFLAVFGNVLGPFYRIFVLKPKAITSFVIYSINLGFADFLMGVYLYIIAGANLKFNGRYGFEDDSWRQSSVCTFAGVLATLSSEASALFVLAITVDRIVLIRNPFSEVRVNTCVAKLVSLLVWFISLLLAVTPLFGNDYFNGYYSSSGICISLPLSVQRKPGWEYSMIIFVGANFIIFIGILFGQILIFADVVRLGKDLSLQRNTKNSREINLAKTLIAVAITDMLCWIPLGVIGMKKNAEYKLRRFKCSQDNIARNNSCSFYAIQ